MASYERRLLRRQESKVWGNPDDSEALPGKGSTRACGRTLLGEVESFDECLKAGLGPDVVEQGHVLEVSDDGQQVALSSHEHTDPLVVAKVTAGLHNTVCRCPGRKGAGRSKQQSLQVPQKTMSCPLKPIVVETITEFPDSSN